MGISSHSAIIKSDGTLWAWGVNSSGQLGIGNNTNQNIPVQVGLDTWKQVSGGGHHSLGIKNDGTLWAWGANSSGQLGIGNNTNQNIPVQVGLDTWKQISCGGNHSIGIKSDGTFWAWGFNNYGQLGIGNNTNQNFPVQVGLDTWKQISGGNSHTLGIKSDGTLWAWGDNNNGQLGIGNNTNQNIPVQVGLDTWKQVSGGGHHSLGIKNDGTLWAWGRNNYGQLGIGNNTNQNIPVQVGLDTWKQVSCGGNHSLGIKSDGTLWAWGVNNYGQLGIGNNTHQNIPVQVGLDTWKQVSCGGNHSLGIKSDGTLWAWGFNVYGRLGIGNTENQYSPVQVIDNIQLLMNNYLIIEILKKYLFEDEGLIKKWQPLNISGEIIASNDFQPNYPERTKESAFDDNPSTRWGSIAPAQDQGWIGLRYQEKIEINEIYLYQTNATDSSVSQISVQASDDESNWKDIQIFNAVPGENKLKLNKSDSYKCWRLLAKTNVGIKSWAWGIIEIQMYSYKLGWIAVGDSPATTEMFENHGMDNLNDLNNTKSIFHPIYLLGDNPKLLHYTDNKNEVSSNIELQAIPYGQLVFQEGDIEIINGIESLNIKSTDIKIIASTDKGKTWKTYTELEWASIIPEKEIIASVGMTSETINSLTVDNLKELINDSNTLRFAYYLNQEELTDEVNVKQISYSTPDLATETPVLEGLNIDYDELTIEGRMKDLEEVNAINLNKLNFKTNALMQSEKYNLHDLVIDTFESTEAIESSTATYQTDYKKYIGSGEIIFKPEYLYDEMQQIWISAESSGEIQIYISADGESWEEIEQNQIIPPHLNITDLLYIKCNLLSSSSELLGVAVGWV